jgi:hypothetical protein
MSEAEVTINSKNARTEWGVIFDYKLTDSLLAPAAAKDPIQSASRLEHGTRTIIPGGSVMLDEREFTLEFGITAPDRTTFLKRYDSFMAELTSGFLEIRTKFIPGKVFTCRYCSCSQFTNYNGRIAKFILKLKEHNPNNR